MRVSNVVIGFLAAIAVAYIHDASTGTVGPDGDRQNIVNWDVQGHSVSGIVDWARDQLGTLADQLHRPN